MQNKDTDLDQIILAAVSKQPEIKLAILFGSLANGKASRESDLDIAVDAGRVLTPSEKISLISELAIKTGRPIDLIDIHAIGEPLLGQILQYGKKILGSNEYYTKIIRRHLYDQADFLPYRNRILAERRQAWTA